MPRGPLITAEVELLIAGVYRKHPRWKAREVRDEVEYLLRKRGGRAPRGWPSLSAVQRVLARIHKSEKGLLNNPQEQPWSIGTLEQAPIHPQALPVVLQAWKSHMEAGRGFTVRQAKWVARLSGTEKALTEIPDLIAGAEMLYEQVGRAPDFTVFDKLLAGWRWDSVEEWQESAGFLALAALHAVMKDMLVPPEVEEATDQEIAEAFRDWGLDEMEPHSGDRGIETPGREEATDEG